MSQIEYLYKKSGGKITDLSKKCHLEKIQQVINNWSMVINCPFLKRTRGEEKNVTI